MLECSATGYASERRALKIRGGRAEDRGSARVSTAERVGEDAASPLTTPLQDRDDTPSKAARVYKRRWLWAVVGSVVARRGRRNCRRAPTEPLPASLASGTGIAVGSGGRAAAHVMR